MPFFVLESMQKGHAESAFRDMYTVPQFRGRKYVDVTNFSYLGSKTDARQTTLHPDPQS